MGKKLDSIVISPRTTDAFLLRNIPLSNGGKKVTVVDNDTIVVAETLLYSLGTTLEPTNRAVKNNINAYNISSGRILGVRAYYKQTAEDKY